MFGPPVSQKSLLVLYTIGALSVLFYLLNVSTMRISCSACASVLLATLATATTNSTPEALNTTDTNLIAQAPGGPTLYYNGSGDVPSYYETSPDPAPITPISRSDSVRPATTELTEIQFILDARRLLQSDLQHHKRNGCRG